MNKCIICGKETKNKKYCSIKCKAKAMSKPKGICLYCGKQLERCETKYCSKECYQKHKKEKYKESLVYNHCVICGKLTLNEKYCSMKCLGKDNSRLKIATKNLKNTYEWTEEKLKFLQENYGKLSLEELEKELNNKKENIIATATRYHIKSQRKWTEEEIEFLKKKF